MVALSYLFSLIGAGLSLYVLYQAIVRYTKIKGLDKTVIREKDKSDYLEILRKYVKIAGAATLINIAFLILPWLEVRMIVSVVSIIGIGNLFGDILDEIADFDTSKKDVDILKEFLNEVKEDAKKKAGENKIKKINAEDLGIDDLDNDSNKENKK